MASYVRNMDTGSTAKHHGNDFLPSWANDIDSIANDNETFANAVGVNSGRNNNPTKDNTNHLGLRKTGTRSNRIAKNAANFQGGNNQSFKQGRGDQSLHGKVQQSTGIKKGTVRNAQRYLSNDANTDNTTTTRKKVSATLELITTSNTVTRGRTFALLNSGTKDVELTLDFTGSTGVSIVDSSTLTCTTYIEQGTETYVGSIAIAPGRASVKMALACKTIVGTQQPKKQKAPPPKPQRKEKQKQKQTAIATHTFIAAESDECSVTTGDECMLQSQDQNGWTMVVNLTTGNTGLTPTNHLDVNATPKTNNQSLNNVYSKNQNRRGSWIGGNGKATVSTTASVPISSNTVTKIRRGSMKDTDVNQGQKNNASDWNDATTNAKVLHAST